MLEPLPNVVVSGDGPWHSNGAHSFPLLRAARWLKFSKLTELESWDSVDPV